ncbi:Non-histone chromosomal protein 6 [Coemansia sp. RSA 1933]|nr:Non-histone chromosomal protein 6 [Coemansia sp. RSA 1933]
MARKTAAAAAAPAKVSKKSAAKANTGRVKKTKVEKHKKDPNAPKRALSAYMFFSQANRASVQEANEGVSFGQIGKLLGAKWKEMSEKEKEPYTKKADNDKARYAKDKAEWDANN